MLDFPLQRLCAGSILIETICSVWRERMEIVEKSPDASVFRNSAGFRDALGKMLDFQCIAVGSIRLEDDDIF